MHSKHVVVDYFRLYKYNNLNLKQSAHHTQKSMNDYYMYDIATCKSNLINRTVHIPSCITTMIGIVNST